MKALLSTIKHAISAVGESLKAAGEYLKAGWYLLRQKVATALLALASSATRQKVAVQTAAVTFWRQHQSQIAWSAVTALLTFALTVALVIVGHRVPAVERWFAALLRGTLRLPAGYALRLLRPVTPAATYAPSLTAAPVSHNSPQPDLAAA
jgi:hypothetical protein